MKVGLIADQAAGHLGELRHHQDGQQTGGDHGAQHHHGHGEGERQETAHQGHGGPQDKGEENGDGDRDQDVLAVIERQDRHRADKGDGDGAGETGVALVCAGELDLHGRPRRVAAGRSMANAGREAPAPGMLRMNNDGPGQKGARTAHLLVSQSREGNAVEGSAVAGGEFRRMMPAAQSPAT
jgi:hypothetical protein